MKNTLVLPITIFVLLAGFSQAGTIAEAVAAAPGSEVTINDALILSTTDLAAEVGYRSFQLRDITRAITVYGTNAAIEAALTGWAAGDGINITGVIAIADGAFRLEPQFTGGTVGGFAVSGRTSTAPFPFPASALTVLPSAIGQPYESDLVCLQNVSFADSGNFAADSEYILNGVAPFLPGGGIVKIVSGLGLDGLTIPSGSLNITGIVIPSSSGDGYCLAPRGIGDIVLVPEPCTLLLLGLGGMLISKKAKRKSLN
jgi:hypothetical protein